MRSHVETAALWVLIALTSISGFPLHWIDLGAPPECGDSCSCSSFEGSACCAQPEPEPEPLSCCSAEPEPEPELSCCADEAAPDDAWHGPTLVAGCSCHAPTPGGFVIDGPPRLGPPDTAKLPTPDDRTPRDGLIAVAPRSFRIGPEPPPPRPA